MPDNTLSAQRTTASVPKPPAKLILEVFERNGSTIGARLAVYEKLVTDAGATTWEELSIGVEIKQGGYIIAKVSNTDGSMPTRFDDLKIEVFNAPVAMVVQENSYYPFGLNMRGLDYVLNASKEDKFQYNGKEKQKDFDLGWYDYHARQYDPQCGCFRSIDPHAEKYANISPYVYVVNNPLKFTDPDGKDIWISYTYTDKKGRERESQIRYNYGDKYDPSKLKGGENKFVEDVFKSIEYITQNGADDNFARFEDVDDNNSTTDEDMQGGIVKNLAETKKLRIDIKANNNETPNSDGRIFGSSFDPSNNILWYGSNKGLKIQDNNENFTGQAITPALLLLHELGHAWRKAYAPIKQFNDSSAPSNDLYHNKEEKWVTQVIESYGASKLNEAVRLNHIGATYITINPTSTEARDKDKK
jgi:RHS repeat-associated protein